MNELKVEVDAGGGDATGAAGGGAGWSGAGTRTRDAGGGRRAELGFRCRRGRGRPEVRDLGPTSGTAVLSRAAWKPPRLGRSGLAAFMRCFTRSMRFFTSSRSVVEPSASR